MKVLNVNGTSDNVCPCGSWIEHWRSFSGQEIPDYCPVVMCMEKPEVGALVQTDSATDRSWYVVPLCRTHNGLTGESLSVRDDIKLASARVRGPGRAQRRTD